ncbi:DNA repair exonuclease [Acetobacteraceae bacterium KSS8]|uniref:DNA repair exonuclease n=1 Tax=Endosaccharibacter trunci TaxID=2812733 RepID=A0ABT1W648_9PROT|nr:DNA repair exonuclease [Acetobacteraceae bacterium KSS8]
MRFLHTSDWQIGKGFRFADDETLGVLQEQRLEAIRRIGRLAREQSVPLVLVAGDVWDMAQPAERTLRQPIECMRQFGEIDWHLIPGNHDPHLPGGLWDRQRRHGLPPNIHLHTTAAPVSLGADPSGREAWLLPAVLDRRHALGDPTAALDSMPTPDGALRIGLAHGSARGFGTDPDEGANRIAADRAQRSGLDYLALGDWHGATPAGPRSWYSGTPETDGFDRGGDGGGSVLLVRARSGADPVVASHRVGRFRWHRDAATLFSADEIDALDHRLRDLAGEDLGDALIWLRVAGALSADDRLRFEQRIRDGVGSALRALRIDDSALEASLGDADLGVLGSGALRDAAEALQIRAAAADRIAAAALQRLLLLARQESGA